MLNSKVLANRLRICLIVGCLISPLLAFAEHKLAEQAVNPLVNTEVNPPNILFILVDDLGWRDLSSYGSDFYQTPNIDKLASSGMKFNQAYAAAHICSPTRMSILTGQYPARLRVTDWIPGWDYPSEKLSVPRWNQNGLADSDVTLGEILQQNHYRTAWIGKWHVRGVPKPNNRELTEADYFKNKAAQHHGFDYGEQDFSLNKNHNPNDPKGVMQLTEDAIGFIQQAQLNKQAWFVALSHYSVHTPVHYNEGVANFYAQQKQPKQLQTNEQYAAMLDALDKSVGRLYAFLDNEKLLENTLIVLTSDNGGLDKLDKNMPTNNAPLRDGKASLYEGGIRIPFIVSWPAKIPANTVNEQMISTIDFLPSFAKVAGVKPSTMPPIVDGIDVSATWFDVSHALTRDSLYWHYPHYHRQGGPGAAMRQGKYKLIHFFNDDSVALYDLEQDISEQHNLAVSQLEIAQRMLQKLKHWQQQVGAQTMPINPNFDPNKAKF